MYLSRKNYVKNWNHMNASELHEVSVKRGGEVRGDIKPERISYIVEQVGYWRKANQIHNWFVETCQGGVDECQEVYVSIDQMKELADLCRQVILDPSKAEELLPTSSGFFFGSTDIDEWYIEQLRYTADRLTELVKIAENESKNDNYISFYYQSSW